MAGVMAVTNKKEGSTGVNWLTRLTWKAVAALPGVLSPKRVNAELDTDEIVKVIPEYIRAPVLL